MSLKNLLRILPKTGSLSSFSRIPATARFSTNNKQDKKDDESDLRQKEVEFMKQGNLDFTGIQMNMENIKRKQAQGRDRELPLGNYKLKRPSQFYDPQKNPNPTASVFNFHEEDLLQKSNLIQIYGLSNGYFTASDVWYPGSIIAFPKQIFLWDVQSAADIRPHSFDILDVIKPTPNYVIIGTGKDMYPLEESIFVKFRERGIKVDVVPTFEACSTYNVCNEDLLNMCAFLIPANL